MVVRCVPHGSVGVGAAPSQNRGGVNNDIPPTEQVRVTGEPREHDEELFIWRRPHLLRPFALLRRTGHPHPAMRIPRQVAGQRESRPGYQPVMQVLVRQAPQRAQHGHEQERLLVVHVWTTAGTGWQWRRVLPLGKLHSEAAQRQQMQARNQRKGIQM